MAQSSKSPADPCKALEEDLVLFHYGDLDGTERETLQSHVAGCAGCTAYLKELGALLPLTVKADEPPQTFWTDYNREMRGKLAAATEKKSWRMTFAELFQPRWAPAFAAVAVIALALTFTIGKGIWRAKDVPQDDEAMIEVLPVAENLEFYKAMDVLDDLDLLESMGNQGDAA
jgi:Putative zinc-finger